jgi:hypothetical protein
MRDNSTFSGGKSLARTNPPVSFEIIYQGTPDIVLYMEYGYLGLTDIHSIIHWYRKFPRAQHYIFTECDWPYPVLPGAYVSLSRQCHWANSWCYLPRQNINTSSEARRYEPHYLFSFLGRTKTHRIREHVVALDTSSSPCLDLDSGIARFKDFDYQRSYRDLILGSKFVLCPRGFGAASIRVFEVMASGRVPVIISDDWLPPPDLPWSEFCVFVKEKDVSRIPAILKKREPEAETMGMRAAKVYDEFFGAPVFFERLLHRLVASYSDVNFGEKDILMRAGRSIGWRELRSIANETRLRLMGRFDMG